MGGEKVRPGTRSEEEKILFLKFMIVIQIFIFILIKSKKKVYTYYKSIKYCIG